MSQLLPIRTPETAIKRERTAVTLSLNDPATDPLLATLSSTGGRAVVRVLQERPMPAARIADSVETTLQNVQYHLDRLETAGLVEVVTTDVSAKGREMDVYALAGDPILVVVGAPGHRYTDGHK